MCHSFFVLHLYCKSIIQKLDNGKALWYNIIILKNYSEKIFSEKK